MLHKLHEKRGGFTLVEIMIVVAIISLLAALAMPNFLRARKRSQATRVIEDLRLIDHAIDQYALETNKKKDDVIPWDAIKNYLKTATLLYASGASVLGGDYSGTTYKVDGVIATPSGTGAALSDVAPPEFWSPYTLVE